MLVNLRKRPGNGPEQENASERNYSDGPERSVFLLCAEFFCLQDRCGQPELRHHQQHGRKRCDRNEYPELRRAEKACQYNASEKMANGDEELAAVGPQGAGPYLFTTERHDMQYRGNDAGKGGDYGSLESADRE